MKGIFPIFVAVAPVLALVSCTHSCAGAGAADKSVPIQQTAGFPTNSVTAGRKLFLRNCAHCHGADARGDEGPDLHDLDWTDRQITRQILDGKKGKMTSFAGKLQPADITNIIAYLRTLQ